MWSSAIDQAFDAAPARGGPKGEAPADRMLRLREALKGEMVAFHDRLVVTPYAGADLPHDDSMQLWQIGIPLTLFPKRDQGFTGIDCIVELSADGGPDALRVLKVFPERRTDVLARAEMGGSLDVSTGAKIGVDLPLPPGAALVSKAAAEVYGRAKADFVYEARRVCVESEIVAGTGARWRLEDPSQPERVGVESHQLAIVVGVRAGARPVHAAGLLQAHSDVRWLTASLGSFWRNLTGKVRGFFERGAPVDAYGEWQDILPG